MSDIENEIPSNKELSPLAEQLEALSAENSEKIDGSAGDVEANVSSLAAAAAALTADLEARESEVNEREAGEPELATPKAKKSRSKKKRGHEEPAIEFQEPGLDFVEESNAGDARTEGTGAEEMRAEGAEIDAEGTDAGAADGERLALDSELSTVDAELGAANAMMVGEAEQLPMLGMEETEEESEIEEPTEFIDNDKLISIVESLLFATDKPVSIATMKVLFKGSNVRTKDIVRALDNLASSYAAAERGVTLEEIHGGYQLRTKVDNTEYLKRLAKVRPFRLSGPALEVLAIAAYKQPITKSEVDQIRGVESGHLMRALMERGMVGFGEKSDLPGRPMTYVTTRKFLETFGLRNLKELPTLSEIDELLPEGIGDEEDKETLSDLTSSMSTEIKGTYSEGEEELQDISESLKVIDTTSEFFEQEKVRQREERDRDRAQDIRERITVGEMVEDKDRKWLSRYEAKQEQVAQAVQAGETPGPLIVDDLNADMTAGGDAATTGGAALGDELAALTSESEKARAARFEGEESLDDEAGDMIMGAMDSDDLTEADDLTANPDFDDEESVKK